MLSVIVLAQACNLTLAARVETIEVASSAMSKPVKACMVLPDGHAPSGQTRPVVYLLHGWSGNCESWVKDFPETARLVDLCDFIVVTPDGGYSSWYFDSPIDKNWRYETFIARELVEKIDGSYHTVKDRTGRAISGLSMGGRGALNLAFKHQEVFGATGSMSGGVNIRPFPTRWNIAERLGDYATHKQNWEDNTVVNLVYPLKPGSLALTIDCGTADESCPANRKLHEELLYRNIPHDYTERKRGHTPAYWQNSLPYHMLFFDRYFHKRKTP